MKLSERAREQRVLAMDARPGVKGDDFLSLIGAGHAPRLTSRAVPEAAPSPARSRIFVRHLQLAARIGVLDWEKLDLQPIVIDLEFAMPSELACRSDNIDDAVDYGKVVAMLKRVATERHHELVESMAETMAATLHEEFGVPWLLLRLTKLAPFPGVEVGIVVERGWRA